MVKPKFLNHALWLGFFAMSAWSLALNIAAEELRLGCLFSDHMVLQGNKTICIWGWGEAGKEVIVSFANQKVSTTVEVNGSWKIKLPPMNSQHQGQKLTVACDGENISVKDVLIGEVWLGSGQSNMAMNVKAALDFDKEKSQANLPTIRMFRESSASTNTPQKDGKGKWEVCSPDTVGGFSATLYFFGKALQEKINVPIGLINSSVGGTPIEAWIDADTQRADPNLNDFFAWHRDTLQKFDEAKEKAKYQRQLAKWEEASRNAKASKKPVPSPPRDPVELHIRKTDIGGLFNGKINPLIPFALRGIVWYQGEANAQPGKSNHYHEQLSLLIRDWRHRWNEELPFAWVQLPGFSREGEYWMEVRDEMLQTLTLPKTGMAITIDVGEKTNIHPQNKQTVGQRLARWALADVYGHQVDAKSGPLPVSYEVSKNEIRVRFTNTDGGLKARESDRLTGFEISSSDNQWLPAEVEIRGDQIIATNPKVSSPQALRYSWAPWPDGNLVNGFSLPASPFQTTTLPH